MVKIFRTCFLEPSVASISSMESPLTLHLLGTPDLPSSSLASLLDAGQTPGPVFCQGLVVPELERRGAAFLQDVDLLDDAAADGRPSLPVISLESNAGRAKDAGNAVKAGMPEAENLADHPLDDDAAGSNPERYEVEGWIIDGRRTTILQEGCLTSSPSRASQSSDDFSHLEFWLDSSLHANGVHDIFSAHTFVARPDSASDQGSPFFYDSDNLQWLFRGIGGAPATEIVDVSPGSTVPTTVEEKHLPISPEDRNAAGPFARANDARAVPSKHTDPLSIALPEAGDIEKPCRGRRRKRKAKAGRGTSLRRRMQPTTVDLRSLLVDCAEAVAADGIKRANDLLHEIWLHASPLGDGMQRLAHYFAESLVARLSGTGGRLWTASAATTISKAYHLFVAVCPFWKLSHFFANQAILSAAAGARRLNVIDFNIMYGYQWPCLIKALSEREEGPPCLRITGIDIPRPGFEPAERVEETGRRLEEYARLYGVPFEYHAVASRWEDVRPGALQVRQDEVVVVNCIYTLRHLMDETMAGGASPRRMVLSKIRNMNPKLFVEGVVNAGYNAPFFLSRFKEALFHYSSVFDALDATVRRDVEERVVIEREIMGREILNVVACEGVERRERPETYRQWQQKTERAGFEMLPLDPCVKFKAEALAKGFYHKDYGVEDDSGRWLLLGWKGRILHGISTWRPVT